MPPSIEFLHSLPARPRSGPQLSPLLLKLLLLSIPRTPCPELQQLMIAGSSMRPAQCPRDSCRRHSPSTAIADAGAGAVAALVPVIPLFASSPGLPSTGDRDRSHQRSRPE
ncbi:hypothetical protein Vretimale_7974, partial [Volvox reticuliferus]